MVLDVGLHRPESGCISRRCGSATSLKFRTARRKAARALLRNPAVSVVTTTCAHMLGPLRPARLEYLLPVVRRFSVPVPCTNSSAVFRTYGDDSATELFWHGFQFCDAVPLMVRLARDASTFIDVGANIGIFTLSVAIANPKITVFAIEPVPVIRSRLEWYIRLNDLTNVSVNETALGDREGVAPLYIPRTKWLPTNASLLPEFRPEGADSPPRGHMDVQVTTLDAFVATNSIKQVDLLKLDTEGTESDVLVGGEATVESQQPTVLCELLPDQEPTAAKFLLDRGYVAFHVVPDGLVYSAEPWGEIGPHFTRLNWLFVHEEKLPSIVTAIADSRSPTRHRLARRPRGA